VSRGVALKKEGYMMLLSLDNDRVVGQYMKARVNNWTFGIEIGHMISQ
jgi:hypothetical protein